MKHPRLLGLTFSLLTASTSGCVGGLEPRDEASGVGASALTADGAPSPVVFHRGIAAASSNDYHALWQTLEAEGWAQTSVSAHRMPDGAARYAGAWQKNPAVLDAASNRNLDAAALASLHQQRVAAGMRMVDLDAESDGATVRYAAVWWQGGGAPPTVLSPAMTRQQLDASLAGAAQQGVRALRISPYRVGSETRFATLWATDGAGGAALVDRPLAEVAAAFTAHAAAGRSLTDLSAHVTNGVVSWTATFVPTPGVVSRQYRTRMTPEAFVDAERTAQREGMVLVDVDTTHDPAAGDAPRVSAVWHRHAARGMVASSAVVDIFRAAVQQQVDAYRAANPSGRVGFLVEDLTSHRFVGYDADLPFYLASTFKVFLGAAAMNQLALTDWSTASIPLTLDRWRGDRGGGFNFNVTDIGATYSPRRWLRAMIVNSDTNATDFFAEEMNVHHGPRSLNHYVADVGLAQVGELSSICDVDRRVFSRGDPASCIWSVPCNVMEEYWRGGNSACASNVVPTTAAQCACLGSVDFAQTDALYAGYFETLHNTSTPREFARFLRALSGTRLMNPSQRAQLIDALGRNPGAFDAAALARMGVGAAGSKSGDRHDSHSRVGLLWDPLVPNDPAAIRPRYSFQVFVEGDDTGSFSAMYPLIVENAVRYLQTH
ncbi:MAG: serine hydrolase [Polyangiales bacterium]